MQCHHAVQPGLETRAHVASAEAAQRSHRLGPCFTSIVATLPACGLPPRQLHQPGEASFKAIIAAYRQQPQAQADNFKSVSMRPCEASGVPHPAPAPAADIISFYNQVQRSAAFCCSACGHLL
jgi:hypothetical protein